MSVEEIMNLMQQNGSEIDPRWAVLAKAMNGQNNQTEEKREQLPPESRLKILRKIKILKKENSVLKNGLEKILTITDELSAITGACPDCLGKDNDCTNCSGKGKPGYYEFDMENFISYFKPCLEKISETNQK